MQAHVPAHQKRGQDADTSVYHEADPGPRPGAQYRLPARGHRNAQKKLETTPDSPRYIQTHIGVGYRMIRAEEQV